MSILPDIEMDMDIDDGGPAPTPTRLLPLPASLREQTSTNSTKEPPASGGESESSSSHFVESEESPFKISNVTGDTEKSSEKAEDDHEKSNGQSEAPENESKVIKQAFFLLSVIHPFPCKKNTVRLHS